MWGELMRQYPSAATAAAETDPSRIESIIYSLGLYKKRSRSMIKFSQEFLESWTKPSQLHGIGKYASDAYFIFCRYGHSVLSFQVYQLSTILLPSVSSAITSGTRWVCFWMSGKLAAPRI